MDESTPNFVEALLLEYTGSTRCGSCCLGILLDQGLITRGEFDLLTNKAPKETVKELSEILDTKEKGRDDFGQLLQKYDFLLYWTAPTSEDEIEEKFDPEMATWDFIAKCVIKKIEDIKMQGMLMGRYNCTYAGFPQECVVEVVQMDSKMYQRFLGSFMTIFRDIFCQGGRSKVYMGEHHLNSSYENTVIVASDGNQNKDIVFQDITPYHIVCLLGSECCFKSEKTYLQVIDMLSSCTEDPLKWDELTPEVTRRILDKGKVSFQTVEISAPDLYNNLEGDQLNQMITNLSLKINARNLGNWELFPSASRSSCKPWRRFLEIGEIHVDNKVKDRALIVCYGKQCDVRKISWCLNTPAIYVDYLSDIRQYDPRKVLVTEDMDYIAAYKFLEDMGLDKAKIRLLQFEEGKFLRVVPEEELLEEDCKLLVITGLDKDVKLTMLFRICEACMVPVIKCSAEELLKLFDGFPEDNLTTEIALSRIVNSLAESKFDRILLERLVQNFKIIVVIYDDIWRESKDSLVSAKLYLYNIIDVLLTNTRLRIVFLPDQTREKQLLSQNLAKHSQIVATLLPPCVREKTDLLESEWGTASNLKYKYACIIYNRYVVKFRDMPASIWKAVGRLYDPIVFTHCGLKAETIPTRIPAAQIYNELFKSVTREMQYQLTARNFKSTQIVLAMRKLIPKFQYDLESIYGLTKCCNATVPNVLDDEGFTEYLVDLFSLQKLTGEIKIDDTSFEDAFQDFFVNRYINLKRSSHLNDMLGYTRLTETYPIIRTKFELSEVIELSESNPNIVRILFDECISQPGLSNFTYLCTGEQVSDIIVADLFGFLDFQKQKFSFRRVLLLCSVYYGFYKLFRFLVDKDNELLDWKNIPIRDRKHFKTLLHLLTYCSEENDPTTITEKIEIIDYVLSVRPAMVHIRDYYGNTSILEANIHFKLVKRLTSSTCVEDTNYMGCSLLHKNSYNTELTNFLKEECTEAYNRLSIAFCARSSRRPRKLNAVPMKKFKYDEQDTTESDPERKLDEDASIVKAVEDYFVKSETRMSGEQVAAHVRKALSSGPITDKFLELLLSTILETEEYSFKHLHLCNIVNRRIEDIPDYPVLSPKQREFMCEKISPFVVATLTGLHNIARFFIKNFNSDWMGKLEHSELPYIISALETNLSDDMDENFFKTLKESGYEIPWDVVQVSLTLGSSTLLQLVQNQRNITKDMQISALTCLLENSMFETDDVIERKKQLIDLILKTAGSDGELLDLAASRLKRAHYRLIRYLFETTSLNLNTIDEQGENLLNYCLENIIEYNEYLGESVYDKSFHHHDQVVYLGKKLGVNSLANEQLKSILPGITQFVQVKTSALQEAGFSIGESSTETIWDSQVLMESLVSSMAEASTTTAKGGVAHHSIFSRLIMKYRTSLIHATNVSSSLLRSPPFIEYFEFKTLHELDNDQVSSSQRALNFWKEVILQERITVDALILAFRQQNQQEVVQILEKILEDI